MPRDRVLVKLNKLQRVDIKIIVDDFLSGLSEKQIAKKYNISVDTVRNCLNPIRRIVKPYTKEQLEYYRENKADLIDAVQFKIILEMANDQKVKKASLKDLSTAFEKLHTAGRLERNQSTDNISMKHESFISLVKELAEEHNVEQI